MSNIRFSASYTLDPVILELRGARGQQRYADKIEQIVMLPLENLENVSLQFSWDQALQGASFWDSDHVDITLNAKGQPISKHVERWPFESEDHFLNKLAPKIKKWAEFYDIV